MPQANSTISSPRVTSPRASGSTLPCSRVRIVASSSACFSIRSRKRNSTRARLSAGVSAHSGNAVRADWMAERVSSAEASATSVVATPSAGL